MDYITRRNVVAIYGTRARVIPARSTPPLIAALGLGVTSRGKSLLVSRYELRVALDDVLLTKAVGALPEPVTAESDGLDARAIENLLENAGLTSAAIRTKSEAFFDDLRTRHSTPAHEQVLAQYPTVVAAKLPIRISSAGTAFVPKDALETYLNDSNFKKVVDGQTCLFEGLYAHDVERALLHCQGNRVPIWP